MSGKHKKVFRVRYKEGDHFRSRLYFGSVPDNLYQKYPGRVLHVQKVSFEELFHVGGSNQLPKKLMLEFRRDGRNVGNTKSTISMENPENLEKEVARERRKRNFEYKGGTRGGEDTLQGSNV